MRCYLSTAHDRQVYLKETQMHQLRFAEPTQ
jgi:hypothetical protein